MCNNNDTAETLMNKGRAQMGLVATQAGVIMSLTIINKCGYNCMSGK